MPGPPELWGPWHLERFLQVGKAPWITGGFAGADLEQCSKPVGLFLPAFNILLSCLLQIIALGINSRFLTHFRRGEREN